MTRRLRAAVVGVGHWGRLHALKYAAMDDVELVAVADIDERRAGAVAAETGASPCATHREIAREVDVVSVAVPATAHFTVASELLEAGVHVLVEKPLATSIADANALIDLARARRCILQAGHIERFNPAWLAARAHLRAPLRIEARRLACYVPRGADVSVMLDLMIHDLDLILAAVNCEPVRLEASGIRVMTDGADICRAGIEFANGCRAELTASRVSAAPLRQMRIEQPDGVCSIDFQAPHCEWGSGTEPTGRSATVQNGGAAPVDALMAELRAFVGCARTGAAPPVSGEDGRRALELALELERLAHAELHEAAVS